MAFADYLTQVIHSPGNTAPIAGEYSQVNDGVLAVIGPETAMLPDHVVDCPARSLAALIKGKWDRRSVFRINPWDVWQVRFAVPRGVFRIHGPDCALPARNITGQAFGVVTADHAGIVDANGMCVAST